MEVDKITRNLGMITFYISLGIAGWQYGFWMVVIIFLGVWGNNMCFNISKIREIKKLQEQQKAMKEDIEVLQRLVTKTILKK